MRILTVPRYSLLQLLSNKDKLVDGPVVSHDRIHPFDRVSTYVRARMKQRRPMKSMMSVFATSRVLRMWFPIVAGVLEDPRAPGVLMQ